MENVLDAGRELQIATEIMQLLMPLRNDAKSKILQTVSTFFDLKDLDFLRVSPNENRSINISTPSIPFGHERQEISAKAFLMEKKPVTDVERIACLAYYLTHYEENPYFKSLDISRLNTEAAQPRFSNLSKAAGNALQYGYLAGAPKKGMKQISAIGEAFVRALPDRNAAREAMKSRPKRSKPTPKSRVKAEG